MATYGYDQAYGPAQTKSMVQVKGRRYRAPNFSRRKVCHPYGRRDAKLAAAAW